MNPSPSMSAIARAAGVAKSTVSMALRNDPRIAEVQRIRIKKIADEMGYQANALVSRLMFELRKTRKQKYVATLAAINANPIPHFHKYVSQIRDLLTGIEQRSTQLGYSLNHFWLHDPELRPERLVKIFQARNIQGIIFYGIHYEDDFQNSQILWEQFPCITIGAHLKKPALHFVALDHHSTALRACTRLRAAGYRRTGIVINRWLDEVMEHRLTAGYRSSFPPNEEQPPILLLDNPGQKPIPQPIGKELFAKWLKKHRLDSCVCINNYILDWVMELGYKVPEEFGLVLLDIPREYRDKAAGMETPQEWVGMIGVDTLIGQINRGERGIPPFQCGSLVESHWVPGPTMREPAAHGE